MFVRDILSTKGNVVTTTTPDTTIGDLTSVLAEHRIGAVIVTDPAGKVCGVISERDVIAALAKHGPDCLGHAVETAMTHDVLTCTPDTTIAELMAQMTERRIRHLPVINEGQLAGVVSIGDVVKYRIAEAEQEADQLREYITA